MTITESNCRKQKGVALLAVLILIVTLVAATVFFFGGPGINASAGTQKKTDLAVSSIFQEASMISGSMKSYLAEGRTFEKIKVNDPDPSCTDCVDITTQQMPREFFVDESGIHFSVIGVVADKVEATLAHDFYSVIVIDLTQDICKAINTRVGLSNIPEYNLISPFMINLNDFRAAADAREMMCVRDTGSSKYIFYYKITKAPGVYT